ncbi:response regulator transcription factor [Streptomyces pathocidini]|uniref:Response regulator n=1 Tax=Streptomyces pathocidini TaxID=1650571 RepID=A0ABW7USD2_9ACTN|nr:response regulator transcription factor [Streptomyces pathocidini]
MSIRVVIVDDHAIIRAGLRMTVNSFEGFTVLGEASDGAEAVTAARTHRPDLMLMDLRMPRIDGVEATRQLMRLAEPPKVLMLTSYAIDERVLDALEAGASGFLIKDTPPQDLLSALRFVAAGGQLVSADVMTLLVNRVTSRTATRLSNAHEKIGSLSQSELRVLELIGRGLSNVQIARQLHLSVASIKTYVSRLLAKVGLANRTQAAILAHEAGIVGNPQSEEGEPRRR